MNSETTGLCEVVITAPDAEWLLEFVQALVDARLASSAHVISQVDSVYRWEGTVHRRKEARSTVRTRISLIPEITDRVQREHPYQVPSLVALPIIAANPAYAEWVARETLGEIVL